MLTRRVPSPRCWPAWPCVLLAWLLLVASVRAQNPGELLEFQKKAEYIASFARFIDWPARKFAQPDSPFVIGVYGLDNISSLLQEALQDRQIKGRTIIVKHLQNKEELRACHVLFVSRSESGRLGPILGEVRRENVLTVGESDNFLSKGGVINFVTVSGQVHFQVSLEAANREKLNVSSKLLQLSVSTAENSSAPAGDGLRLMNTPR